LDDYKQIYQKMQKTHKVLLLGSGLMTPPLIEHLIAFGDTKITVASNVLSQAE
jgi:glutamyl-tRNA reductase